MKRERNNCSFCACLPLRVLIVAGVVALIEACTPPSEPALDNPYDTGGEVVVFPPKDVEVYASSFRRILLRWEVVSRNATAIVVERSVNDAGFARDTILPPYTSLYNDQPVDPMSRYSYRLRSRGPEGDGVAGPPMSAAYNLQTMVPRSLLFGLSGSVTSLAVEHTLSFLYVAGGDDRGVVAIWRTLSLGSIVSVDSIGAAITDLDYAPTANLLAIAAADSTLRIGVHGVPWKLPSVGQDIAFTLDGQALAVALAGGVRLYDLQGQVIRTLPFARSGSVVDVDFSPDGTMLAECWDDGMLRVWNTSDYSIQSQAAFPGLRSCAFTPDGRRVAGMNSSSGEALVVGSHDAIPEWQWFTGYSPASAFGVSPDNFLCAATGGGTLGVWTRLGKDPTPLEISNASSWRCLAFSHDASLLVAGGENGVVQLVDLTCAWEEIPQP